MKASFPFARIHVPRKCTTWCSNNDLTSVIGAAEWKNQKSIKRKTNEELVGTFEKTETNEIGPIKLIFFCVWLRIPRYFV